MGRRGRGGPERGAAGSRGTGGRPLRSPDPDLVRAALVEGLRREGIGLLRWTRDARPAASGWRFCTASWATRGRTSRTTRAAGPYATSGWARNWPRRAAAPTWSGSTPARRCAGCCRGRPVRRPGSTSWRRSGSRCRAARGSGSTTAATSPVLAVKLQELFGWREAPRLAGGRVPVLVHLLSPAGRPAAVTADLASFWRDGYRAVRAELRGRYPRHPWPEDPSRAEPTRRTHIRR